MKATVLLVDDEQGVTASLKLGLESYGFAVDAFNDPKIALANFKESKYDIVILDIRMPRMNGFELFRELRKIDGQTRFCFLTAFEIFEREFETIFPDTKVKTFLKKPISAGELAKRLMEVLPDPSPIEEAHCIGRQDRVLFCDAKGSPYIAQIR